MNSFARIVFLIAAVSLILPAGEARPEPGQDCEGARLEELSWMTGFWKLEEDGKVNIECWFAPANGVMLGVHQDIFNSGKVFFEYLRIVETDDGIVYYASPGGKEPTAFRLTSLGSSVDSNVAVFENPEHDFPVVIRYTWDKNGKLTATIEGRRDGKNILQSWTWHRAEFPGVKK